MKDRLPDVDTLWDYNDPEESERRFRELMPLARRNGDETYVAVLLTQVARAQGLQRRFGEAHATLDQVAGMSATETGVSNIRYLLERGRVLNSSGHPGESSPYFLQAWKLAQELGEDYYAVDAAHMLGIVEPPDRQLHWNLKAVESAQHSHDERAKGWLGSLYNNIGWTYQDLGEYGTALEYFWKGLEWRREQGPERESRIASWTVGRAPRSLGRTEEALEMQGRNLREAERAGKPDGYIHEELGECLLALGREYEAREHFARAYQLLSHDQWLVASEPERLKRLKSLGAV
ncbi:MAG: tetratricopeptide repeat protein [Chloroflexota bacterium]|nr:tetratricopeptide repeat protein [Chloroflexota bacterium]